MYATAVGLVLTPLADAAGYVPPRTTSGTPDLQGIWDSDSLNALARPPELKSVTPTDAQAADHERRANDKDAIVAEFRKARPNAADVGVI